MTEETIDKTITIAGVRFRENWKVYDFDASGIAVAIGDRVIVDSDRGLGFASVVRVRRTQPVAAPEQPPAPAGPAEVPDGVEIDIDGEQGVSGNAAADRNQGPKTIRKIVRKATEDDIAREEKNRQREAQAFSMAQDMIAEREMPMKLIRVEYAFDASRTTFFFFSENRIDFRELVKDLAFKLKSRIEMRQIGVRDVARMIGGFGPCGRELCCSSFLKNFEPVSIRMAKKQEMVLNPAKISGVCGRLLCCLSYEYEMFEANKKDLADMRQTAIKEKKDEEERRAAAERKEAEEQRQAEEKEKKHHADQRRQQEQRRDKQKEGGQKSGGKQEKKKDQQQERKPQPAQAEQRQQQKPEKRERPDRPDKPQRPERPQRPDKPQRPERQERPPQAQDQSGEQSAPEQQVQQPQQEGEKQGRKKRRRFWRKKKKPGQGDSRPPQGDGGGQGAA